MTPTRKWWFYSPALYTSTILHTHTIQNTRHNTIHSISQRIQMPFGNERVWPHSHFYIILNRNRNIAQQRNSLSSCSLSLSLSLLILIYIIIYTNRHTHTHSVLYNQIICIAFAFVCVCIASAHCRDDKDDRRVAESKDEICTCILMKCTKI